MIDDRLFTNDDRRSIIKDRRSIIHKRQPSASRRVAEGWVWLRETTPL